MISYCLVFRDISELPGKSRPGNLHLEMSAGLDRKQTINIVVAYVGSRAKSESLHEPGIQFPVIAKIRSANQYHKPGRNRRN
jgi:hypothetical protein